MRPVRTGSGDRPDARPAISVDLAQYRHYARKSINELCGAAKVAIGIMSGAEDGRATEIQAAMALLEFYREAGVDLALGEDPVDRFLESRLELEARQARAAIAPPTADRAPTGVRLPAERSRPEPQAQPQARVAAAAAVPSGDEVAAARQAAASAATLDELRDILGRFSGCNLKQTAKALVFADGNPQARVMFVGEAPGREEDEAGLPFVGRSGQLLDRMLAAIGLDRTQVYIANVVPWRPPGNRTPTPQETEICKPFIARQIELVDPDVLVFLGGASAAALAGTKDGILKLRGRWLDYDTGARRIKALATLHPAYLLRQPIQKRLAWRDFLSLRRQLDENSG